MHSVIYFIFVAVKEKSTEQECFFLFIITLCDHDNTEYIVNDVDATKSSS